MRGRPDARYALAPRSVCLVSPQANSCPRIGNTRQGFWLCQRWAARGSVTLH